LYSRTGLLRHIEGRRIRAGGLLLDRQRSLVERFGVYVPALSFMQFRQVVEAGGDRGMVRPEGLLINRKGSLVEWFSFGVAALGHMQLP